MPAVLHLQDAPRNLFFTGKGGVGKTTVACASAIWLAEQGRRVLLVSTDPASNLDEVLATPLSGEPRAIAGVPGLKALNLDPVRAAAEYRERMVAPYRELLPAAALRSIEEQLSGACTVEIAAFDQFSHLLDDQAAGAEFDHVVFDTAPTGHTLRLLELPAAWSQFLANNAGGTSCLGPLAGLAAKRELYLAARNALMSAERTRLVLVARLEAPALREAERTRRELEALGMPSASLVLNGCFRASDRNDPLALAIEAQQRAALVGMPAGLAGLQRSEVALKPFGLVGLEALRDVFSGQPTHTGPALSPAGPSSAAAALQGPAWLGLESLLPELAAAGHGVIMTMGKGGVGKTRVALEIAQALARLGHRVHLTTTDPAANLEDLTRSVAGLSISRIDPLAETQAYAAEMLAKLGAGLDATGRALLEEDLRSPCTKEIAVFRAFARHVDHGEQGFVVIDTAPTGHTLLLLDAAESYHREVERTAGEVPPEVRRLLPRLRDPRYTRAILVALPEATPVHEALQLQLDLQRAGIQPYAWVVNQCLTPLAPRDPLLVERRSREARYLNEVRSIASRAVWCPWQPRPAEAALTAAGLDPLSTRR
jgi:arsenite/tail-anchored protein-transporting ATPase